VAHVVILGGGFGGLAAAHELRTNHPEIDVTLIDRRNHFFMGFAKLWDLAGTRPLTGGTRTLTRLADRGVNFVQSEISAVDPIARTVSTGEGVIEADALLIAFGAVHAPPHVAMLDGAPNAHDAYDATALDAIHADLDAVANGRVVISILGGPYQCPPAPFELALIVDERLRARGVRDQVAVTVTTPLPMSIPVAGVDASRYVAAQLGEHDIELRSDAKVKGVDAASPSVALADGSSLDYSVLLGVPASAAPPLVRDAGLAGESGFIEPDRFSMQTSFTRVYAVGDCTHIPNAIGALPKAGVFAAGEGTVAARNLAADLTGSGERATFDGHGYCFLELPGKRVAFVEGDFYAEPRPDVTLSDADHEHYVRKQQYEEERLDLWLG
jgi:sulfide:quinone oxidoreductase